MNVRSVSDLAEENAIRGREEGRKDEREGRVHSEVRDDRRFHGLEGFAQFGIIAIAIGNRFELLELLLPLGVLLQLLSENVLR